MGGRLGTASWAYTENGITATPIFYLFVGSFRYYVRLQKVYQPTPLNSRLSHFAIAGKFHRFLVCLSTPRPLFLAGRKPTDFSYHSLRKHLLCAGLINLQRGSPNWLFDMFTKAYLRDYINNTTGCQKCQGSISVKIYLLLGRKRLFEMSPKLIFSGNIKKFFPR